MMPAAETAHVLRRRARRLALVALLIVAATLAVVFLVELDGRAAGDVLLWQSIPREFLTEQPQYFVAVWASAAVALLSLFAANGSGDPSSWRVLAIIVGVALAALAAAHAFQSFPLDQTSFGALPETALAAAAFFDAVALSQASNRRGV